LKIYYSNIAAIKTDLLPSIGVLVSYYGLKKLRRPDFCDSLFLDSGAFSAWNQGVEIDIDSYIEFIKEQKERADIYCVLDNILSGEESFLNYTRMLDKGLSPVPCYHYGEPSSLLKRYIEISDYVALGGIAKKGKKERIVWLDRIFSIYPFPLVKFHGFGIQDRSILLRYPWWSVDSSSAHVMARFGGICTPWGDYKINPEVNSKDLRWISPNAEKIIIEWVSELGFSYDEAQANSPEGTIIRSAINVIYYEELSKLAPRKFSFGKKRFGFV